MTERMTDFVVQYRRPDGSPWTDYGAHETLGAAERFVELRTADPDCEWARHASDVDPGCLCRPGDGSTVKRGRTARLQAGVGEEQACRTQGGRALRGLRQASRSGDTGGGPVRGRRRPRDTEAAGTGTTSDQISVRPVHREGTGPEGRQGGKRDRVSHSIARSSKHIRRRSAAKASLLVRVSPGGQALACSTMRG